MCLFHFVTHWVKCKLPCIYMPYIGVCIHTHINIWSLQIFITYVTHIYYKPLKHDQPTMTTPSKSRKWTIFPMQGSTVNSSSAGVGHYWFLPASRWNVCWLTCSSAGNHSHCEFINSLVLKCPGDPVSLLSTPPSLILSAPSSSVIVPQSWRDGVYSALVSVALTNPVSETIWRGKDYLISHAMVQLWWKTKVGTGDRS